ncbi:unnamed protein product, partial [Allacma fusca]
MGGSSGNSGNVKGRFIVSDSWRRAWILEIGML